MTPPSGRFRRAGDMDVPLELPRGRGALPPEVVRESQRRRLIQAMTELAATKGFVGLTVTDLVERAGVARKSFYEAFADKTDCYLTGYRLNAEILLERFAEALRNTPDPVDGVLEAMRAYVRTLGANPLHARAYLVESVRAGHDALSCRWTTLMSFVEMTHEHLAGVAEAYPDFERVSENTVVALIGGVNELACRELDRPAGVGNVAGLEDEIVALTLTLLGLDPISTKEYVL